jgi:hypothetical protein
LGCLLPDLAGTESKEIIKYSRANLFDILVSFCEVYNDLRVFWNTRFRIETSSMLICEVLRNYQENEGIFKIRRVGEQISAEE